MAIYLENKTEWAALNQPASLTPTQFRNQLSKAAFCVLKNNFKKGNVSMLLWPMYPNGFLQKHYLFYKENLWGRQGVQGLWQAVETDLPSAVFRIFPRLLICFAASSERFPWTTEMLTPAFSKTCPSWSTQLMPPPPVYRNSMWGDSIRVDANPKQPLSDGGGIRSYFPPLFSKSSIMSVYL